MDKLNNRPPGMYVGEAEVSLSALHEAIDAAARLLGKHVFPSVEIRGDRQQCDNFARDIVAVAEMLQTLTKAITDGRKVSDNGVPN